MNTRPAPSSKATHCLMALAVVLTAVSGVCAQGVVMQSTPQAEISGFFDQRSIGFTDNATQESLHVTPLTTPNERTFILVPELHLDMEAQTPAPRPPRVLLPSPE